MAPLVAMHVAINKLGTVEMTCVVDMMNRRILRAICVDRLGNGVVGQHMLGSTDTHPASFSEETVCPFACTYGYLQGANYFNVFKALVPVSAFRGRRDQEERLMRQPLNDRRFNLGSVCYRRPGRRWLLLAAIRLIVMSALCMGRIPNLGARLPPRTVFDPVS